MFFMMDIELLFWCFRYLKVVSRSIYIYISVFRQLDIQAGELFPWISMHHRRRPRSAGPTSGATGADRAVEMGRKWSAQAAQEFLGCAGAMPARQDDLEVAPAKMSSNKSKSAAPGVGGCNTMKGLTIMSCPSQTEKNAQDCLKITRGHFS